MYSNEKVKVRLQSGFNVDMSIDVHDNYFRDFTESQFFSFSNFINAGHYFPQIVQFVVIMIAILNGKTSLRDIILFNLVNGVWFSLTWFWLRFYKIPGLAFLSCLIGGNVFRLYLHFIPIAIIAFFVVKDWKVLLFCVIGGIITFIVKSILFAFLSNVKYHDEVVRYVSAFKYKQ